MVGGKDARLAVYQNAKSKMQKAEAQKRRLCMSFAADFYRG